MIWALLVSAFVAGFCTCVMLAAWITGSRMVALFCAAAVALTATVAVLGAATGVR